MASGLCAALTGRTHGCTDQPANVKKTLANSEPSTHGTKRTCPPSLLMSALWGKADIAALPSFHNLSFCERNLDTLTSCVSFDARSSIKLTVDRQFAN